MFHLVAPDRSRGAGTSGCEPYHERQLAALLSWGPLAEDCQISSSLYLLLTHLTHPSLPSRPPLCPAAARNSFVHTLGWLNQWACSRSFGLGTR